MMEDLGAGFYLAMHGLEIRGAGEVLGESQSGGIHDVGFALYTEMLEHAVRSLKKGKEPDLSSPFSVATEVNLHAPALLPETYCGDVHERLVLYKRLANCQSDEELERLTEELVDRFGPLPDAARVLLECHKLRIQGAPLGVQKIDAASRAARRSGAFPTRRSASPRPSPRPSAKSRPIARRRGSTGDSSRRGARSPASGSSRWTWTPR